MALKLGDPTNGPDVVDIVPEAVADLELAVFVDNHEPLVGSTITLTAVLTNNGLSVSTGSEHIVNVPVGLTPDVDTIPAGVTWDATARTLTWPVTDPIAANDDVEISVSMFVEPTGPYTPTFEVTAANETDSDSAVGNGPEAGEDDGGVKVLVDADGDGEADDVDGDPSKQWSVCKHRFRACD